MVSKDQQIKNLTESLSKARGQVSFWRREAEKYKQKCQEKPELKAGVEPTAWERAEEFFK